MSVTSLALFQNLIHDAFNRRSGVDCDTTLRDIFFRCMQSHNQLPFARSSAKLIFWSPGKPPVQRVESTSRTKTPSNKSIKRWKFLEPPQKKEIALR